MPETPTFWNDPEERREQAAGTVRNVDGVSSFVDRIRDLWGRKPPRGLATVAFNRWRAKYGERAIHDALQTFRERDLDARGFSFAAVETYLERERVAAIDCSDSDVPRYRNPNDGANFVRRWFDLWRTTRTRGPNDRGPAPNGMPAWASEILREDRSENSRLSVEDLVCWSDAWQAFELYAYLWHKQTRPVKDENGVFQTVAEWPNGGAAARAKLPDLYEIARRLVAIGPKTEAFRDYWKRLFEAAAFELDVELHDAPAIPF